MSKAQDNDIVFGLRAIETILRVRPEDIDAIFATTETNRELRTLAIHAKVVSEAELRRRAESDLHEGICAYVRPRTYIPPRELLDRVFETQGVAIALDRVRNPYNVGAILRSAAFLGLDGAILGAKDLDPLAVRVAEGGADAISLARTTELASALEHFRRRGGTVLAAEADANENVFTSDQPRPTVIVVGNERDGISERVRKECSRFVAIPARGILESLNVGMCATILMTELVRADLRGVGSRPTRSSRKGTWR